MKIVWNILETNSSGGFQNHNSTRADILGIGRMKWNLKGVHETYLNLSLGFTTNFDANQNYSEHQIKYSMENMRSMIDILNKYDCIGDSKCSFTFPLRANFVCKYSNSKTRVWEQFG